MLESLGILHVYVHVKPDAGVVFRAAAHDNARQSPK